MEQDQNNNTNNTDASQFENGERNLDNSYSLTRDELLKYIEIDLWSRFRTRLFGFVGVAIALITLAGLIGIPYYINNELNNRLQKSTAEFEIKTTEILRYTKLISLLAVEYNKGIHSLRGDIDYVVNKISEYNGGKNDKDKVSERFLRHLSPLRYIDNYHAIGNRMTMFSIRVPDDQAKIKIAEALRITTLFNNFRSSSLTQYDHPVQNGTLAGILKHIRYQIVAVEALRRTIAELRQEMLEIGGTNTLEKRTEKIGVITIFEEEFPKKYLNQAETISKEFLSDEEGKELNKYSNLYYTSINFSDN